MKPNRSRSTALRFLPLAVLLALGCLGMYLSLAAPVPEGKPAAYPGWWFEREVIARTDSAKASPVHPADYPPAADFAALNQGQLKQFATAAFDELQVHLPGGAGPAITALVQSWYVTEGDAFKLDAKGRRIPLVTGKTSDFAPATHGQLKEVARHFFDRLQAELYYPTGQSYPWDAPIAQPVADYAVANLGQIKSLFQFDLATDSDQDGIPDWWEKAHGLNHKNRNDALSTSAGGRMTNLAAYRNHLDPADASAPVASSLAPSDPPAVITLRSSRLNNSTTDSSSAFIDINPGSPPLIKNGNFEEGAENRLPSGSSDFRKWYVGEGPSPIKPGGWKAIGGDQAVSSTDPNAPGSRANHLQWEVQQQLNDYTLPSRYSTRSGMLNQYVELDAHWERVVDGKPIVDNFGSNPTKDGKSDRNKESDHGIKQTVSLSRGNYLLLCDYRGRVGSDSNQFKVSAKGERAVDVETDLIAEKDASDPITGQSPTGLQKWKQGSVSFSVSGGNPADTAALPVILKFDLVLAAGKKTDSFGVFIDNVILLPVQMITINTFIPFNYVQPLFNDIFAGDDRTNPSTGKAAWNKNGSHRTQQKVNLIPFRNMGDADGLEDNAYNASDPAGVKNASVLNHVQETTSFDPATSLSGGRISVAAKAEYIHGAPLMKNWATGSNSGMSITPAWLGDRKLQIRCVVSADNPLVSGALWDNIDYDLTLIIDLTDAQNPKYSLTGSHDGFPAYEVYIGDKRVYEYDPIVTVEGLLSLGPPMEKDVNATTNHVNQPLP